MNDSVEFWLKMIYALLRLNFPEETAIQVLNAESVTVPASSEVEITYSMPRGFIFRIKNFYVDALPDSEVEWHIGGETYYGNELPLSIGLLFGEGYSYANQFSLIIRNNSITEKTYDILIEGWGWRNGQL